MKDKSTVEDTLKDIDKIGDALEKKLGKKKLGSMLEKIERKPIYQLYDTFTTTWQECKVCRNDTSLSRQKFICKSGKEMERHIRKKHQDRLTDNWKEEF